MFIYAKVFYEETPFRWDLFYLRHYGCQSYFKKKTHCLDCSPSQDGIVTTKMFTCLGERGPQLKPSFCHEKLRKGDGTQLIASKGVSEPPKTTATLSWSLASHFFVSRHESTQILIGAWWMVRSMWSSTSWNYKWFYAWKIWQIMSLDFKTQMLHIFTHIWLKFMVHVGKYSSPMQHMGNQTLLELPLHVFSGE